MAKSNKKQIGRSLFNLRKNKGSVLFLVVAIMSVMVILASALYYSLSTARRQVEVKYDSQQAYQSALALNDLIVNFINIKNDDAFVQAIIDLNQNESLVTKSDDGSGFSELAAGLGNYKVTVNKVKGDASDEIHVLEIEVSIDVNGENSTISTIGEFKVKSKPYNFDRFFTSTGYAPNDVIFKNMKNAGTIYLDNEYTQFGSVIAGDSNDITIKAELISAGTVRFEAPSHVYSEAGEITIGNSALFNNVSHGFSPPLVRIGGNAVWLGSSGALQNNVTMYILGDFYFAGSDKPSNTANYINGDMIYKGQNPPDKKIYINGDLFFEAENAKSNDKGNFIVGGNVYYFGDNGLASYYLDTCHGNVYNLGTNTVFYQDGTIESITGAGAAAFDKSLMYFNLASSTDHHTEEEIRNRLDYIESYCNTPGGKWNNVWPSLNGTCEDIATVKQRINEKIGNPEYINWDLEAKFYKTGFINGAPARVPAVDSSKQLNLQLENDKGTVIKATTNNDYYIIKSVKGGSSRSSIIFDTFMGDYNDPTQVADKEKYANMYIYLEPNCYVETTTNNWGGTDVKINTDDSSKFDSFSWDTTEFGTGVKFILTRGMGSVTFVVPEGVRYIQPNNGYLGHMAMLEQTVNVTIPVTNNNGVLSYGFFPLDRMNSGTAANTMKTHFEENTMGTANILSQDVVNLYNNPNDPTRAFYIHNNVFLATISKNAIMDFSGGQNMLSGFIYAPYMTFNSEGIYGPAESGMVGGMIVSDFIQSSQNDTYVCTIPYDYYGRYVDITDTPEKQEETRTRFMEKLMSDSLDGEIDFLTSSTSRTWRKFGYN